MRSETLIPSSYEIEKSYRKPKETSLKMTKFTEMNSELVQLAENRRKNKIFLPFFHQLFQAQ